MISIPTVEQCKSGESLLRSLKQTYPFRYGKAVLLWTGDTDTPYKGWTLFTTKAGARSAARRRLMAVAHILGAE